MNNHGPRPESQLTSPESWERWFDIRDDRGLSWNCQNTMPDAVWATHHPPAVTRTCRVRHHGTRHATEHCVVCEPHVMTWHTPDTHMWHASCMTYRRGTVWHTVSGTTMCEPCTHTPCCMSHAIGNAVTSGHPLWAVSHTPRHHVPCEPRTSCRWREVHVLQLWDA